MTATYTIKKGDTLWGLSYKTGIDIDTLARLNNLQGDQIHNLSIGQILTLPDTTVEYDTELSLKILNLDFKAINNAQLKLTYDEKVHETKTNSEGFVPQLMIHDHAKGIKVEFKTIEGNWIVIADHKSLPLGKKLLTITSRQMVINGSFYGKPGAQRKSKDVLKKETIKANAGIHIEPQGTSTQPKASAGGEAKAVEHDTRVEAGTPTQLAAPIFIEGNLLLQPGNEQYRKLILASAERYEISPHALAALIHAEAAKDRHGTWNKDSQNRVTSAAGLAQFIELTWLDQATKPGSMVNQKIKEKIDFSKLVVERNSRGSHFRYGLQSIEGTGKNQTKIPLEESVMEEVLKLRFDPEVSIDTAAFYGQQNLRMLQKNGFNIGGISETDAARVIYFLHHEGPTGALELLKGSLKPDDAQDKLKDQIGVKDAVAYIRRFDNDPVKAYLDWLLKYVDTHINVVHFMVKSDGINSKPMLELFVELGGASPVAPLPKAEPASVAVPQLAGPAEGWHDPLINCSLRTAGLASVRGATFGMVRKDLQGKPKSHQGIDLKAEPGTPVYAVANGVIVAVCRKDATPGENYGKTLTLAVDINDLPEKQREMVRAKKPDAKRAYFFYAHLSEILNFKKGTAAVRLGDVIGASGSTGNANKMISIPKGAHLHFEVRIKEFPGLHLADRIDPLPFINNCN